MNRTAARAMVAAAVVVDVVLVVGLMNHVNRTPPSSPDLPRASVTEPAASAAPVGQDVYAFKPAQAATMSMSNDGTLLFATRGQCDGDDAAKLVVSTNGGVSTSTPTTGLQEILAVSAASRTELRVVGADGTCSIKKLVSSDGGDTWTADTDNTLWHPGLDDPEQVVSPDGASKPGCTVTSLSQIGADFARASCADGSIRGTGNGGKKWFKLGRLDNVRVASFSSFNAGYALAVYQGCAAQEFTTRDSGRTWSPGGCISGEPAQAIEANDTGLVALVDSQLYASDDGGKAWSQP